VNSLLTGKNTGKFRETSESEDLLACPRHCEIGDFGKIPYAKEQGMSDGITGKIVLTAGNFLSLSPLPFKERTYRCLLFGGRGDIKN
jgi:hypothetical protein